MKKAISDSQAEYQLSMLFSLEGVLPLLFKMKQDGIFLAEPFQILVDIENVIFSSDAEDKF